jgi:hypothetical protein
MLSFIHPVEETMAVTHYVVVTGAGNDMPSAIADLQKNVSDGLTKGWQPLGGVTIAVHQLQTGSYRFVTAQAMGMD